MAKIRNITKTPAVMEDFAVGRGTVLQKRGTGNKVDLHIVVESVEALASVNTDKYTRARVYSGTTYSDYVYADAQWQPLVDNTTLVLKIFQSPTDGDLTEVQTRTVSGGEVYGVRKVSDDSLATIYVDENGTTEITQNGIDNVSSSDGVVEFYAADGDYYVEVDSSSKGFSVDTNKRAREVSLTLAITEDAELGVFYSITDLSRAIYEVVAPSDSGGFYIVTMSSGRKLKYVHQGGRINVAHLGVVANTDCSDILNSAYVNSKPLQFNNSTSPIRIGSDVKVRDWHTDSGVEFKLYDASLKPQSNSKFTGNWVITAGSTDSADRKLLDFTECLNYSFIRGRLINLAGNFGMCYYVENSRHINSEVGALFGATDKTGKRGFVRRNGGVLSQVNACKFIFSQIVNCAVPCEIDGGYFTGNTFKAYFDIADTGIVVRNGSGLRGDWSVLFDRTTLRINDETGNAKFGQLNVLSELRDVANYPSHILPDVVFADERLTSDKLNTSLVTVETNSTVGENFILSSSGYCFMPTLSTPLSTTTVFTASLASGNTGVSGSSAVLFLKVDSGPALVRARVRVIND